MSKQEHEQPPFYAFSTCEIHGRSDSYWICVSYSYYRMCSKRDDDHTLETVGLWP
jgi:hypothetical protein